jgi:hypothetical protein
MLEEKILPEELSPDELGVELEGLVNDRQVDASKSVN